MLKKRTSIPSLNTWYNFTITLDYNPGGTHYLESYIDGKYAGGRTETGDFSPQLGSFQFSLSGTPNNQGAISADIDLKSFGYWNRILTPAEILENANYQALWVY